MSNLDDLFDTSGLPAGSLDILASREPPPEASVIQELRTFYGLDRFPYKPYSHQVIGIHHIVTKPYSALFDEMGAGKTIQTIIAACLLILRGEINRVVIVAPASIRSVWFDQELGEIRKHILPGLGANITQFHSRSQFWSIEPKKPIGISDWIVTNYELLRSSKWLKELLPFMGPKTLLVLDESSAIKSWKAAQTKATRELRARVKRVVMLNGTPVANNPLDLFSQGNILHPSILGCGFITHFRARYCEMGGYEATLPNGKKIPTQVIGWKNLPELTARFAPYVLRRLKTDCLDLPPKLPPTIVPVPLDTTTWGHYKKMRDEMVTWLSDSTMTMTAQAMVKAMRLAQITSGFIGGVESLDEEAEESDVPEWLSVPQSLDFDTMPVAEPSGATPYGAKPLTETIAEISREKLDALLDWVTLLLENDPSLKLLVWCRFKPEALRATAVFREHFPSMTVHCLRGGQPKAEEREALKLLDPRHAPKGAATLFSTSKGSMGFSFTASHTVARLSRDYSLWRWLQSDDRVHRPGQTSPISYTDFVATGPKGQRTVDVLILRALLDKFDLAKATTNEWRAALAVE